MVKLLRRWLPLALVFFGASAMADKWVQPTPEELGVTIEPAAPGASAIYLFREEQADDKLHFHSVYARLKVLTESGRKYADVEIPYLSYFFTIRAIEGRTIHSDGTVIPFAGKPYDKVLEKTGNIKYNAKVFTLPDVQVGSILEYRYVLGYQDYILEPPQWYLQQPLYVRKAHYKFIPSDEGVRGPHGQVLQDAVNFTPALPKGVAVQYVPSEKLYTLDIEKVAAIPREEHMPPMESLSSRVLFYYSTIKDADRYWKTEGAYWSREIERFASPGKLGGIVSGIVAASDTPDQKARKIYDAVMTLENTSFTRERNTAENKAEGIKIKTAEDIWSAKRGTTNEIALLYVGLARAAGLEAYVAQVTDRDRAIFIRDFLSTEQLDDMIAIVVLDSKEEFLDPGERYCAFERLHWKHTLTGGLRQTIHGTELVQTPAVGYKDTSVLRNADLYVAPDGKVHGTLRIAMTGDRALYWRQRALITDETEVKKDFEASIQKDLPAGIEVKVHHFLSLTEYDKSFMAALDVTGSMGAATAKRVFLPATFFEAGSKTLFAQEKRTAPVDLNYAYAIQDKVVLHLPNSFAVESTPKDEQIALSKDAVYQTTFRQKGDTLEAGRLFILTNPLYTTDEYSSLKDFFQKVNAKDQEQAVFQVATAPSAPVSKDGH